MMCCTCDLEDHDQPAPDDCTHCSAEDAEFEDDFSFDVEPTTSALRFSNEIFPICALCNKPVESIVWSTDLNGRARYIAKCHGDTEVTEIDLFDLKDMTGPLRGVIAFAPKPKLTVEGAEP